MGRGAGIAGAVAVLAAGLSGAWLLWRDAGAGGVGGARVEDIVRREAEVAAGGGDARPAAVITVDGTPVRRDTFVLWLTARGETSARQAATVASRLPGEVAAVPVEEGQTVERGQVLVRLESTDVRLDLEGARAAVEEARSRFRSMTLTDGEFTGDSLRRQRREEARVRSGLASATVKIDRQRTRLEATRVRAPFDGQVASVAVSEGDRVSAGDSLLAVIDLSRARVAVRVLESELPAVEVGRRAEVRFAAYPNRTFGGRVASVNPVVDAASNTARVTVSLEKPPARIAPGMHASVRIAGRLHRRRTFVPREAIVERDRREVVFVFAPSASGSAVGRAQWRYVSTGLENDRFVEIVPGEETEILEPGEIVLTKGHTTLAHDARVRLRNAVSLDPGQGGAP